MEKDGCVAEAGRGGGNLEFPAMRRLSISTAHAFLLVYSIDDRASFDEVRRLWEQIKEERTGYNELPCVVAGNKVSRTIHVENVFASFFILVTFLRFFYFPNVFFIFKNVRKVQSGKQTNEKHFQNNSNEIDL